MPIPILTEPAALAELAAELHGQPTIAVDLEADSMHNYQEKVCLLQISTPKRTVLVDPLAITDLRPLRPVMADPRVRKIFHAADYDIRCLFRDCQLEVRGLFDTMVSCQFLGEEKVGLAAVLDKFLNVKLDKRYQKADWSRRPLSPEMVRYAAEDTRHLHTLVKLLEKRLKDKGRLAWVAEEFSLLEQVRHNQDDPGPLFLRAKGAWNLNQRQLAVLEGLLQWRDSEARQRDCPLFKVIGTKPLIELARAMPADLAGMKTIDGLFPRLVDRYGRVLAGVIKTALALPEAQLPVYPRAARQPKDAPAVEARLKALKKWRGKKAAALGMEPGIVINTALLEEISRRPPADLEALAGVSAMKNWQREVLGAEILEILQ